MADFGDLLWSAATFLAILNFASLSWGVRRHFVVTGGVAPGMRLITCLTLSSFAWFVWARVAQAAADRAAHPLADASGLAVLSLDMALFWWAVRTTRARRLTLAFSADQPCFLHESGPYAWVRHPFYVSYVLFWVATALLCHRWAHWLVPAAMAAVYVRAARMEEAKFAASHLAADYERYRSRTVSLPRLRGAG